MNRVRKRHQNEAYRLGYFVNPRYVWTSCYLLWSGGDLWCAHG